MATGCASTIWRSNVTNEKALGRRRGPFRLSDNRGKSEESLLGRLIAEFVDVLVSVLIRPDVLSGPGKAKERIVSRVFGSNNLMGYGYARLRKECAGAAATGAEPAAHAVQQPRDNVHPKTCWATDSSVIAVDVENLFALAHLAPLSKGDLSVIIVVRR